MKRSCLGVLTLIFCMSADASHAGDLLIVNKSKQDVKVSSIGGQGIVPAQQEKTISFKNEENGADINIWWTKNARQLCQIYTPWDRQIHVTGKYTIQCLSKQ